MPRVQNPSLGPGSVALLYTVTNLTAAQVAALGTTPVQLIPAPKAGYILIPVGFAFIYNFGTVPYQSPIGETLSVSYESAAGDQVTFANSGLMLLGASGFSYNSGTADGNGLLANDVAQPLVLWDTAALNTHGAIQTTTLGAGGAGYAVGDTGRITTGAGNATYRVLTVGGGGAVLTYSITAPGTEYPVGNGQATATGGAQPGIGAGFTINVTAITIGDGTLRVVSYYQIAATV